NLADLVVDWDALRAINPDIVAWVYMPGTIINYPVAHKDGDSEYYLHHNFSLGEGSFGAEFGSIMLSGENAGDFSDEVNILYGHHMRNGSMFALFAEFRDSAIFNEHRTIYLLTPGLLPVIVRRGARPRHPPLPRELPTDRSSLHTAVEDHRAD
ncbi:MAG: class B sortase, partial [Coriobacteriaceae bacterium]